MRLLAIDFGQRRTGLAIGDDDTRIVTPITVVEAGDDQQRLDAISAVVESHGPEALVLGLPLNMDGSEGPAAQQARAFAEVLRQRFAIDVHLHDERLSSAAANDQMARSGLSYGQKKARRDALSAATILRDFLAGR